VTHDNVQQRSPSRSQAELQAPGSRSNSTLGFYRSKLAKSRQIGAKSRQIFHWSRHKRLVSTIEDVKNDNSAPLERHLAYLETEQGCQLVVEAANTYGSVRDIDRVKLTARPRWARATPRSIRAESDYTG
jgi:hypothetical protein